MKVVWMTRYGDEGASTRYRAMQYIEPLARDGVDSAVEPLAPWRAGAVARAAGIARRLRRLRALPARQAGAIVVQKEPLMPPALWQLARGRVSGARTPIIWDIDDAVWIGRRGARAMAEDMAQLADVVVAGNVLLARWAATAGASRVEIIPTCYRPLGPPSARIGHDAGDAVRVVWIGSPASVSLLDASAATLRALFDGSAARLTTIGAAPTADFGAIEVEVVAWSPEAEHTHLSRADYGLALQPRTEYADHKCGFKVVQYLAYGVIPIATDSPVHADLLGGVGHLLGDADSVAAANAALRRLPTPDERDRARQRWATMYDTEVGASRWRAVLASVERS